MKPCGIVSRLLAIAALVFATEALAQTVPLDPLDARLRRVESELRCLVCQNQTLAESEAPLAADLRREIREIALAGRSDDEIRAFLVARYGDFVLYRPPLKPITWLLWLGPFALLALGATVWWSVLRRRGGNVVEADVASPEAQARARALLSE